MQRDLWGNTNTRRVVYHVFHDESLPNKRWFLIGLLFVREDHLEKVREALQYWRRKENYWGEIHFSDLPKKFGGKYGAKARVARHWMRSFESGLADIARFTDLAVDRHSHAYDHKRFSKDYHAYNRFTAMALKAGIAWFLVPENWDEVKIFFVSDAKDRLSRPDEGWEDNFDQYLPYRATLDAFLSQGEGKPYPTVNLRLKLLDSAREDLLQLCDLLLGATQMALVAGSTRPTKKELGKMVVRWCEDLRRTWREQKLNLFRKYDLWAFPDESGAPYSSVPLKLKADDTQIPLFEM